MIIKKNSESYKKGIRYSPNLDTITPNAEKAARILGLQPNKDYSVVRGEPPSLHYESMRTIQTKFYWWDLVTAKSE